MHNMRLFYLLLFLIIFIFSPKSEAKGLSDRGKHLVSLIQKKYETTMDITSKFKQETFAAGSSEALKSEGKVYFSRPHQMRWEYTCPESQLIVTSGQEVYVYEEEESQVMVFPRDQLLSNEISKAFFLGKGDLTRYFIVEHPVEGQANDSWMLKLIPRNPVPQVRFLWIFIDPGTHLINEMWLQDQLGGKTHLLFRDIKVNKGLSPELFQFVPPPGVEIYRTNDLNSYNDVNY